MSSSVSNVEPEGSCGGRNEKWLVTECPEGSEHGTGWVVLFVWSRLHLPLFSGSSNLVRAPAATDQGKPWTLEMWHPSVSHESHEQICFYMHATIRLRIHHLRVRKSKHCDVLPTTVKGTTTDCSSGSSGMATCHIIYINCVISVSWVVSEKLGQARL
jgi:hypothetical protein